MNPGSRLYRFISCFLAGTTCAFCLIRIGHRFLAEWLLMRALLIIAACLFSTGLGYGIVRALSKPNTAADTARSTFLLALIRYMIAIDLIMIAIQGFLQLFFFVPLAALDFPFSTLSGEQLTWAYFGHYSRGFVYFIGSVQILGSILILFRRTCLLGIFVLMPVMFAIVAINYFFDMEQAESVQAIEILVALLFLFFSDGKRVSMLFLSRTPAAPALPLNPAVTNLFRASAVLIPLFLLWRFGPSDRNPAFTGKYKVSQLIIDNRVITPAVCSDSVLTNVYLDIGNECVFEFNGQQRRWYGTYSISGKDNNISIVWHYPLSVHDTLAGVIKWSGEGDSSLSINGKLGMGSIKINLLRHK